MDLEFAIVHDLRKEVGAPTEVTLRHDLLEHSDSLLSLSSTLHSMYQKKSTKGFGRFDEDTDAFKFSTELKKFTDNGNETDFITFTHKSMSFLKTRIASENLATGGYVLFISYTENNDRFLFITVLRQTIGCVITSNLDIDEAKHLEMDKLHTGCQIDISTWEHSPENQYITFIKGRSTQTTPQYFLNAIGCDEFANSVRQTNELIRAVNDFADKEGYTPEERQTMRQVVFDFCSSRESVMLDSLSQNLSDNEPEKFLEFINSGDYKVGNGFEPHKVHLKKLKEFKAKGEGIEIKFPKNMLGSRIQLDENKNQIIINNPPDNIVKTFKEES